MKKPNVENIRYLYDFDMDQKSIQNIKPFVENDSSQSASDAQKNDVVNWGKIHEIRGNLNREIKKVAYDALNRKKSRSNGI